MNPPDPLHWSLNSSFGVFRIISVSLRPFGCLTKLGAKHSELVQKFVPRSRVGIFRNESTRSTPWEPKLMFWCISSHLDPFGTVRFPCKTHGKTGRTSAKVRGTKSSRIFFATNASNPPHWNLNSCFGAFRTVLVHLRPFGCLVKLGAEHSELVQKFVPRSRVGIICNERTRSTPLDPKLMFWSISYHLGAFGIVKLTNGTRGQTFRTSAKVRATKSRRNFLKRKYPIHPMGH